MHTPLSRPVASGHSAAEAGAAGVGAARVGVKHGHLWQLADGTGLHAPVGQLVRESDSGRVCCHLCGQWFRALGSHVRVHGYTGSSYREAMGLLPSRAMTSPEVSDRISRRQSAAYRDSAELRERLLAGQRMARNGQLARRAKASRDQPCAEWIALRSQALADGRATRARLRDARTLQRMQELGVGSLADYLRVAYADGASLLEMSRITGLGQVRLRTAMRAADIAVRPPGQNTPAGKRSRAIAADAEAARRVGTDDLVLWLVGRRAAGTPLSTLARETGRSSPWVRARLSGRETGVPNSVNGRFRL